MGGKLTVSREPIVEFLSGGQLYSSSKVARAPDRRACLIRKLLRLLRPMLFGIECFLLLKEIKVHDEILER